MAMSDGNVLIDGNPESKPKVSLSKDGQVVLREYSECFNCCPTDDGGGGDDGNGICNDVPVSCGIGSNVVRRNYWDFLTPPSGGSGQCAVGNPVTPRIWCWCGAVTREPWAYSGGNNWTSFRVEFNVILPYQVAYPELPRWSNWCEHLVPGGVTILVVWIPSDIYSNAGVNKIYWSIPQSGTPGDYTAGGPVDWTPTTTIATELKHPSNVVDIIIDGSVVDTVGAGNGSGTLDCPCFRACGTYRRSTGYPDLGFFSGNIFYSDLPSGKFFYS